MNEHKNNTNDDLLVKYLLDEANAAEQQEVKDWINTSAENRKYFEHFQLIWEQSKVFAAQSTVDENAAWQRFVARTEADEEVPETVQPVISRSIPLFQRTWLRVAAMLLIFCGIGWVMYRMNQTGVEMVMAQSGNTTLTDTLPDGSVVVLNKNSSLSFPSKFEGGKRNVILKGEAFFSITPDKSKPFIIDANDASVMVVGTTFNVKTSPERTEIIVETGIVQVTKKAQSVKVTPNQKATVVKGKDAPETESITDELYNYYRTNEFVCKNTPLRKLVAVLNEAYNVQITLADKKIGDMPLTVTFKNETLDNILKVIKETLNINIERKGDKIILSQNKADK